MPLIRPAPAHGKPDRPVELLIVQQAASQWGISKETLWGVYGVESRFGENAVNSTAGACCFFQFMPATAREMGVTRGNFRSEAFGAAHYLHNLGANRDPESVETTRALNKYNGNGGGDTVTGYVQGVREKGSGYGRQQGPVNAVTGAVGDAVDAITSPLDAVGDFLGLLGQSSTWFRVGKVVAGGVLLAFGAGALILTAGREVSKVTPMGRIAKGVTK